MRSYSKHVIVALFAVAAAISPQIGQADDEACGEYGTAVAFASSPAAAAKEALKHEKLVFILHVSGHFEKSEYT